MMMMMMMMMMMRQLVVAPNIRRWAMRYMCKKYVNIPSGKYIYVHIYVCICVYTYLLGRCSYSSRGTDLVSSVSVPLGGALKK